MTRAFGLVSKQWILIAAIVAVTGAGTAWFRLRPKVNVTVRKQLVGPEDEALILVQQGAPLDEVKSAVQRAGKRVDQISWLGGSLLFYAVDEQRIDVTRWLLEEGANPNGIHRSMVPLERGIRKENFDIVNLLIQSGANPDLDMGYGITPRWIAESVGNQKILSALPVVPTENSIGP